MGSFIELNDTLQLTHEQGFPTELDYERHLAKPISANDFKDKIFEFKNKNGVRIFHTPPVRVFLVQNIGGKWLYWGHVHLLSFAVDGVSKTTSGTFKIISLFTPDEMKRAFELIDGRPEFNYFNSKEAYGKN